ncbi:15-hydroxyprostaglandin dehydrogenase [NAD(+)]-like [Haliotis rubra]|uniref:15-hydroxyprostaglandin dehydrogenase [NAD(+)]-like n=1 Tax=Haliotis rubra TaxID=36100 RepID=UPI001EE5ADAD|nr:15-hydroxyprostaglandin dehydrogenase [NAD(+)]-like [Haliotis rubra]
MQLKGKTAFLTGGVGGIGIAFAQALLDKGCKVCITDINADAGRKLETQLRRKYHDNVVFIQCDVTSASNMEDVFKTAVARFGCVDIMLNNAGIMHEGRWEDMISIMMRGTVIGTELAIAHMRKDKGGRGGGRNQHSVLCRYLRVLHHTRLLCCKIWRRRSHASLGGHPGPGTARPKVRLHMSEASGHSTDGHHAGERELLPIRV